MSTPGISNISTVSDEKGTFQIHANGTDFFISIIFFNQSGFRKITKYEYKKLQWETNYKSPFVIGSLHILDNDYGGILGQSAPGDLDLWRSPEEYRTLSNGGSFIKIKIDQQSAATKCERITLIDDVYICKSTDTIMENNEKIRKAYDETHFL